MLRRFAMKHSPKMGRDLAIAAEQTINKVVAKFSRKTAATLPPNSKLAG